MPMDLYSCIDGHARLRDRIQRVPAPLRLYLPEVRPAGAPCSRCAGIQSRLPPGLRSGPLWPVCVCSVARSGSLLAVLVVVTVLPLTSRVRLEQAPGHFHWQAGMWAPWPAAMGPAHAGKRKAPEGQRIELEGRPSRPGGSSASGDSERRGIGDARALWG